MPDKNDFLRWRSKGYERLLPIMPPDGEALKDAVPGRTPAVKGRDGKWRGLREYLKFHPAMVELEEFGDSGAGVGLVSSAQCFAIDVDASDPERAEYIEELATALLGSAPKRVGRAPKFALLYRMDGDEPLVRRQLKYDGPNEGDDPDQVEIPTQLVIEGLHHKTRKPYTWSDEIPHVSQLTAVTSERLDKFFSVLQKRLPRAQVTQTTADRAEADQERLAGDPEQVEALVRSMTPPAGQSYEEWIRVCAAIKGALPGEDALARELFYEYSAKYVGEQADTPERVFDSVKPPFALGVKYLISQASEFDPQAVADMFFVEPPAPGEVPEAIREVVNPDKFRLLTIDQIMTAPRQRWLIDQCIPERSLGFIYGQPGSYKSFFALDWALSLAYGFQKWQEWEIHTLGGPVVYIAAEGQFGMRERIAAWQRKHGLFGVKTNNFRLLPYAVNFMKPEEVVQFRQAVATEISERVQLVIVDTVSRALPGADENLQKDMTLFVAACGAIQSDHGCPVVGLHHVSRTGNMRGSTVLEGAGDFIFRTQKVSEKKGNKSSGDEVDEAQDGRLLAKFYCAKQKDAPDGWTRQFSLDKVAPFGNFASSLVPRLISVGTPGIDGHDFEAADDSNECAF